MLKACNFPGCTQHLRAHNNTTGRCQLHRSTVAPRVLPTAEKRVVVASVTNAGYSTAQGQSIRISLPREPWRLDGLAT